MPEFKAEEQIQPQIGDGEEIGAIDKQSLTGIEGHSEAKVETVMPTFWVQSPPGSSSTFWRQVRKAVEHTVKQGAEDAIELFQKQKKQRELEEKEKERQEQLKNMPAPTMLKPPILAPPEAKAADQAPANKAAGTAAPAGPWFPSSMGSIVVDETGPSGSA
ncbi:hypothetical protein OROMI_027662 [Orobanche minor]